jgi:hypothetical protein
MADAGYLHFVLGLHASIQEHAPAWHLHVVCLDQQAYDVIERLGKPGMTPIPLAELLRQEPLLKTAQAVRPFGEFARCCKPQAIRRVLEDESRPAVVTWLDADSMCFAGLDPILDQLGDASVLLTPAGSPQAFRKVVERTGRFMGGLVSFRDDETGRAAVAWWAERCLVGGNPRVADTNRFGDQKYLQEVPATFESVAIVAGVALRLAPFNIELHDVEPGPSGPQVDGSDLIIFHYTGFRELQGGGYEATYPPWRITRSERELLYEPFRARIAAARRELGVIDPGLGDGAIARRTAIERAAGAGSRVKGWMLRSRQAILRAPR